MKTLIVEDDLTSRLFLNEVLKRQGETDTASTGFEAINTYRAALEAGQPYDLICLDIMMPELDGQKVLREVRRLEAEAGIGVGEGARVIMTTALGDSKNVMAAFREQCDAYLVKPIDVGKLYGHLRSFGLVA
jgi:two-component system, chemotaxis family, chemotaxis protein CheY